MTGRFPARLHLTTFIPGRPDAASQKLLHPAMRQQLPLEETTLAERLHAAGYATAMIGKWHLGGEGFSRASRASTGFMQVRRRPRRARSKAARVVRSDP